MTTVVEEPAHANRNVPIGYLRSFLTLLVVAHHAAECGGAVWFLQVVGTGRAGETFSESCEYPLVKRMGRSLDNVVSFDATAAPPSLGIIMSRIAREGTSLLQSLSASSPLQAERTR